MKRQVLERLPDLRYRGNRHSTASLGRNALPQSGTPWGISQMVWTIGSRYIIELLPNASSANIRKTLRRAFSANTMAKLTRELLFICWVLGVGAFTYGYAFACFVTILGQPGFYISMGLDGECTCSILIVQHIDFSSNKLLHSEVMSDLRSQLMALTRPLQCNRSSQRTLHRWSRLWCHCTRLCC
jgi:hypothetical protein